MSPTPVSPPLVTPLTLGTSGLGRGSTPGTEGESAAIDVAVDLLTAEQSLIDTSNNYSGGRAEQILGSALARLGMADTERIISKIDADPESGRFDRDRALRSFEETITRLGVDRLPLLQLHDPYTVTFDEAMGRGGAVEALLELRESGQVGAIGVAAGPAPLMARYVETGVFDAVLIHNRFTLIDRSAEPVFVDAKARGMTVFNAAPFGSGILVKGAAEGAIYQYRPAPPELLAWVSRAERICAEHGIPLAAAALHFSLRSAVIDSTVVGVASAGRRAQLAVLVDTVVPDDVWAELDGLGPAPSPVDDSEYV